MKKTAGLLISALIAFILSACGGGTSLEPEIYERPVYTKAEKLNLEGYYLDRIGWWDDDQPQYYDTTTVALTNGSGAYGIYDLATGKTTGCVYASISASEYSDTHIVIKGELAKVARVRDGRRECGVADSEGNAIVPFADDFYDTDVSCYFNGYTVAYNKEKLFFYNNNKTVTHPKELIEGEIIGISSEFILTRFKYDYESYNYIVYDINGVRQKVFSGKNVAYLTGDSSLLLISEIAATENDYDYSVSNYSGKKYYKQECALYDLDSKKETQLSFSGKVISGLTNKYNSPKPFAETFVNASLITYGIIAEDKHIYNTGYAYVDGAGQILAESEYYIPQDSGKNLVVTGKAAISDGSIFNAPKNLVCYAGGDGYIIVQNIITGKLCYARPDFTEVTEYKYDNLFRISSGKGIGFYGGNAYLIDVKSRQETLIAESKYVNVNETLFGSVIYSVREADFGRKCLLYNFDGTFLFEYYNSYNIVNESASGILIKALGADTSFIRLQDYEYYFLKT